MSKRKMNKKFKHGWKSEGVWKKEKSIDESHKKEASEVLGKKVVKI